jgi:hypothetical protein
MVNRDQFFSTPAHFALRREKLFRSGFIRNTCISGNVAKPIDRVGSAINTSAD